MKLFIDGSALLKRKEGYMEYTDGTLKYKVEKIGGGGVLRGVILAFSGQFDSNGYPIDKNTGNADTTWHLCDGTNGTPDLRGRFILGASASHAKGTTGGEEETGLSIANLPPHHFSGTTSQNGQHNHKVPLVPASSRDNYIGPSYEAGGKPHTYDKSATTADAGLHDHTFTTNTLGEGKAHNNMPPFYTLSYIMKL